MQSLADYARSIRDIKLIPRKEKADFPLKKPGFWAVSRKVPGGWDKLPNPPRSVIVPPELEDLWKVVSEIEIFHPERVFQAPRNSWQTANTDTWLAISVNEKLLHSDFEKDGAHLYLRDVYVLAMNAAHGVIAVDTHRERLGWIGYFRWNEEHPMSKAGYPVVAHSFREWLERTVEAGPDVLYWQEKGFKDLGSAIPNDPNYKGPRSG
jgi:hypothetical protein